MSTLDNFANLIEVDLTGVDIEDKFLISEKDGHEIPVRIYSPKHLEQKTAGLIHLHGGGFVIGSLDSEKSTCVNLCRDLHIVVISIDYRLAPEHPYPKGLDDCYTVLSWVARACDQLLIDPLRLGIFGLSAGAGICAGLALLSRDQKGPKICFQYLGIPELDGVTGVWGEGAVPGARACVGVPNRVGGTPG